MNKLKKKEMQNKTIEAFAACLCFCNSVPCANLCTLCGSNATLANSMFPSDQAKNIRERIDMNRSF